MRIWDRMTWEIYEYIIQIQVSKHIVESVSQKQKYISIYWKTSVLNCLVESRSIIQKPTQLSPKPSSISTPPRFFISPLLLFPKINIITVTSIQYLFITTMILIYSVPVWFNFLLDFFSHLKCVCWNCRRNLKKFCKNVFKFRVQFQHTHTHFKQKKNVKNFEKKTN